MAKNDAAADPFKITEEAQAAAMDMMFEKYGEDFLTAIQPRQQDNPQQAMDEIQAESVSINETFPGLQQGRTIHNPLDASLQRRVKEYQRAEYRDKDLEDVLGIKSFLQAIQDNPHPSFPENANPTQAEMQGMQDYYDNNNKVLDIASAYGVISDDIAAATTRQFGVEGETVDPIPLIKKMLAVSPNLTKKEAGIHIQHLSDVARKANTFLREDGLNRARDISDNIPKKDKGLFLYMLNRLASPGLGKDRSFGEGVGDTLDAAYGRIGTSAQDVKTMLLGTDEEDVAMRFHSTARQMKDEARKAMPTNLASAMVYASAEMAPAMQLGITTGTLVGMAGGALFPAAKGVGAATTGALSNYAATAAEIGASTTFWATQEAPDMYGAMRDAGVRRGAAAPMAILGGLGIGAIENLQIKGLSKLAQNALGKRYKKELIKGLARTGREATLEWAKQIGEEEVQELISVSTEAFTRAIDPEAMGMTKEELAELPGRFREVAKQTALATPLLMLPGTSVRVLGDVKSWKNMKDKRGMAEMLGTPKGLKWFTDAHPTEAKALAEGTASRKNFDKVLPGIRFSAEERGWMHENLNVLGEAKAQNAAILKNIISRDQQTAEAEIEAEAEQSREDVAQFAAEEQIATASDEAIAAETRQPIPEVVTPEAEVAPEMSDEERMIRTGEETLAEEAPTRRFNQLKRQKEVKGEGPYADTISDLKRRGIKMPTDEEGQDFAKRRHRFKGKQFSSSPDQIVQELLKEDNAAGQLARSMTNEAGVNDPVEILDAIMTAHNDWMVGKLAEEKAADAKLGPVQKPAAKKLGKKKAPTPTTGVPVVGEKHTTSDTRSVVSKVRKYGTAGTIATRKVSKKIRKGKKAGTWGKSTRSKYDVYDQDGKLTATADSFAEAEKKLAPNKLAAPKKMTTKEIGEIIYGEPAATEAPKKTIAKKSKPAAKTENLTKLTDDKLDALYDATFDKLEAGENVVENTALLETYTEELERRGEAEADRMMAENEKKASKSKAQKATGAQAAKTDRLGWQKPEIIVQMEKDPDFKGEPISTSEVTYTMSTVWKVPIVSGGLGTASSGTLGAYYRAPKIIRMKGTEYGEIAVTSHEVAHHIDNSYIAVPQMPENVKKNMGQLDYDAVLVAQNKGRASEGFAEMMRLLLTSDMNAELAKNVELSVEDGQQPVYADMTEAYDWTKQFIEGHPQIKRKFDKSKRLITGWRKQGFENRFKAQVRIGGKTPSPRELSPTFEAIKKAKDKVNRFYMQWKDKFHSVQSFDLEARRLGSTSPKITKFLQALSMTGETMAINAVTNRPMQFELDENGDWSVSQMGESLASILGEHEIVDEQYEKFTLFITAEHALEYHGVEPVVGKDGKITYKKLARKPLNPGMLLEDAKAVYEMYRTDGFLEASRKVTDFANDQIDMAAKLGVISTDEATKIKESWKTFKPFSRVMPETQFRKRIGKKSGGGGALVQGRSGGGQVVVDPIENLIQRTGRFYSRAVKQMSSWQMVRMALPTLPDGSKNPHYVEGMGHWIAEEPASTKRVSVNVQEIIDTLRKEGAIDEDWQDLMDEVQEKLDNGEVIPERLNLYRQDFATDKTGDAIVMHVINGKPKLFRIERGLFEVMEGLDPATVPEFIAPFRAAAQGVKLGATGLSTAFGVRNIPQDWVSYIMQTTQSRNPLTKEGLKTYASPFYWMVKVAANNIGTATGQAKTDPMVELYRTFGGELAHKLGTDYSKVQHTINSIKTTKMHQQALNMVKNISPTMQSVIGFSEIGPRMAEFSAIMNKNGYPPEKVREMLEQGQYPPMPVLVEAIHGAADVTTNFKRQGSFGQYVNMMIPFFNARIESFDKMIRNVGRVDDMKGLERLMRKADDARVEGNYGEMMKQIPAILNKWDGGKRMLANMAAITSMTAMYWLSRKDEDWYKDTEGWAKYGYFLGDDGKGGAFRMPRGHSYGWLLSASVEAHLNQMYEDDPKAIQEWMEGVVKEVNPLTTDVALTKTYNEVFNAGPQGFSEFRQRPIVSDKLARYSPTQQFNERTSAVAKHTSQIMDRVAEGSAVPPVMIDYLINGYTGGLWDRMRSPDVAGLSGVKLRNRPSRAVSDLYDTSKKVQQRYNDSKLAKKPDPILEMQNRMYSDAKKRLGELRDANPADLKVQSVGLARAALGQAPLSDFPYTPPGEDVARIASKLTRMAWSKRKMTPAQRKARAIDVKKDKDFALRWMSAHGLSPDDMIKTYIKENRGKMKVSTISRNVKQMRINFAF